jgi:hypothetical protein
MTYASCVWPIQELCRGWRIGRRWRRLCFGLGSPRLGVGLAQYFEHDRAARRALAFNGFAPVFHRFLHAVGDFLFGFALYAISFGHKSLTIRASCPNGSNSLTNTPWKRNPEKGLFRKCW